MIISQTPLRIPLLGGGTDLPIFSKKYGGVVLTASINKYVYVIIKKNIKGGIRFTGYYNKEIVSNVSSLKHKVIKAVLRNIESFKNINDIEIISLSDLPGNSGLGSSSSFTVGLINALYKYLDIKTDKEKLAKQAHFIEREILGEEGGVQDQFITSYGGIIDMRINKKEKVLIKNFKLSPSIKKELNKRLILFDTNIFRYSKHVHKKTFNSIRKNKDKMKSLFMIKKIALRNLKNLKKGNLDYFGKSMDEHWELKKKYGYKITSKKIDKMYETAKLKGALGGKIIGAGSGGFFSVFAKKKSINNIKKSFKEQNINYIDYKFTNDGSKIIMSIK